MADGLQVFGTGEKPTSAKMNKVARRVIIDVANAAALPTPATAGMTCHLLDTNELFYYNGTNWLVRPKGWAGSANIGVTGGAYEIIPAANFVEVNGSSITVTATGHSFYKYTAEILLNSGGGGVTHPNDVFAFRILRTSGGTDTQLGLDRHLSFPGTPITSANISITLTAQDYAPAASCNYHVIVAAIGGNVGGGRVPGGSAILEHMGGIFLG